MAGPVFFVILSLCDNNPKSIFPCGYDEVLGVLYYKRVSGSKLPISVFGWASRGAAGPVWWQFGVTCWAGSSAPEPPPAALRSLETPQIHWELAGPQLHKLMVRRGCL